MKLPDQIELFLFQMRSIIQAHGLILVGRSENLEFINNRGYFISDLCDLALSLTADVCFDGPEKDRDSTYSNFIVAEFSPIWNVEKVYLKLSISSEVCICKCLSIKEFVERGSNEDN